MKPKPFQKKKIKINDFFAWKRTPRTNGWIKYTLVSRGFYWLIQINPNTTRKDMAKQIAGEKKKFAIWREFGTAMIGGKN